MNIGVNLFGPKKKLYQDFAGTIEKLKEGGVTSAEACIAFNGNLEPPKELNLKISQKELEEMSGGIWNYKEAAERIAMVRSQGLEVVSAHFFGENASPERLLELLPLAREFARANKIRYYVISLMKNLEEIKPFVPVLRTMTEKLAEIGVVLAYHNHEIECMPEEDTTALDYLLANCSQLKLELDVGWAKFAKASPVELMRKYQDRIVLLHFKDIREDASPATRDTCFTAVGQGSIPLRAIMAEAKNCPIDSYGFIIDQDDSPGDIVEDLIRGVKNIIAAV